VGCGEDRMSECGKERKRRVARMYDLIAGPYERWGPRLQPVRHRLIRRLLGLRDDHRLLDIGTGPGVVPFALRRLGYEGPAVGIDIARGAIERAEARAASMSCNHLRFKVADAERLPFPDASFDRVTSVAALLLVPDRAKAVSEIARTLKDRGRGVIVDPRAEGPGKRLFYLGFGAFLRWYSLFRPEFRGISAPDCRGPSYLSPREIAALVEGSGMRVRAVTRSLGYTYCAFEKNGGGWQGRLMDETGSRCWKTTPNGGGRISLERHEVQ